MNKKELLGIFKLNAKSPHFAFIIIFCGIYFYCYIRKSDLNNSISFHVLLKHICLNANQIMFNFEATLFRQNLIALFYAYYEIKMNFLFHFKRILLDSYLNTEIILFQTN